MEKKEIENNCIFCGKPTDKYICEECFNNGKRLLCKVCGQPTRNFRICDSCRTLIKKQVVKKDFLGEYVINQDYFSKLKQQNFYQPEKKYILKESLCNDNELKLYKILNNILEKELIALPQINLQTIIDTDKYERNNELFRNLDFCIFEKETLKPILAIELNGKSHQEKRIIKRDESVKQILENAKLPLITIQNEEMFKENFEIELHNLIIKVIKKN